MCIFGVMLPIGVVLCTLSQYWVFPPLAAIITARYRGMFATICCRCSAHLSSRVWRSSPRFCGGLSMMIARPNSSQICSLELQSGDLTGCSILVTLPCRRKSRTNRARWAQSLATNSPALLPRPLTCGVSSECLGTRSYETTSRDQRGKIEMFFSSTGACTAAKFPIANHYSQINTQLYSASLIRHIWQQRYSDSEFDAL